IAALFVILGAVLWLLIVPLAATPSSAAASALIEKIRNATEANGAPYVHVFAVLALALTVLVLVAQALAWWCVSRVTPQLLEVFRSKMRSVELLRDDRPDPRLTHTRLISAFVNGITYNPLHFLLLAAFGALFSSTKWLWATTTAFAVVAVFLIMWGSLSSRWEQFIQLLDRWFLSGTPLVVSLAAIVIGVLRLMDVQYVSTILDAAPFGTLFVTLVMAYTGLWLMEYWINRWLGERLLWVLGAPHPRSGYWVYGPPLSKNDGGIPMRGQVLALHGTGRLAVHGWYWRRDAAAGKSVRDIAFITFGYIELFDLLAKVSDPDCANNIRRRVRLYFNAVNIVLLLMVFGFLALRGTWNKPLAQDNVVSAVRDATPEKPFDLAAEIVQKSRAGRDSLIVAASGGGTRAALYTVTALEGLARLDRTRDIVLLSGVSGGGVAAAYFANRFDQFQRDANTDVAAWNGFRIAMGEPFIQDVLDGASEWRIQSATPLGTLLAESFERRLFTGPKRTLGDLSGVGLILNTTVSGHPRRDSVMLKERIGSLRQESCLEQSRPFSSLAGGRLVFTNLSDVTWQPKPYIDLADVRFDYTFVRDGHVPLAAAAALNANFPPVFSNARVRLAPPAVTPPGSQPECPVSYFVTDGGATENLGLLSALYALRAAIPHITQMLNPGERFPEIHLVAIEASAITYDYSQDRGIGAATGGSKERIAGGLTQELMRSIYEELPPEAASAIHIHYLPLPLAFRSRGGYGTHWMSARTVRVSNPLIPEPRGRIEAWWRERLGQPHYEALDECQVTRLWSQLYRPGQPFCSQAVTNDASMDRVAHWICGNDDALGIHAKADWQVGEWEKLVLQLRNGVGEPAQATIAEEACP
ncbi:MAG: patatin-like phospholipase family protein, partial [Gammaproteobacteria bacterium]